MIKSLSRSFLPTISIDQLQKNYLQLKRKNKNKHGYSYSNLTQVSLQSQLQIKSPFYKKITCKKQNCKCQYHRKQKFNIPLISYNRFDKNKSKEKIGNRNILQTLGNQNLNSSDKLKVEKQHKRFKSLLNQNSQEYNANKQQQKHHRQSSLNDTLYKQYLNYLKTQKQSNLDCHNIQFQQYLKLNNHWVLRQSYNRSKQKYSRQKSDRTSSYSKSRYGSTSNGFYGKNKKSQLLDIPFYYNKKLSSEQNNGKYLRKKNKLNTEILSTNKYRNSEQRRRYSYGNLGQEDKGRLNDFLKSAFKELGIEFDQNDQNMFTQKNTLFSELCKNLIHKDPKIIQNAKKLLQRISRLPLNLFQCILGNFKQEIQQGYAFPVDTRAQQMQKVVNIALTTLQSNVEQIIKNKQQAQGKEKLEIIHKFKGKYTGRGSLNLYKNIQNKNKSRLSNYGEYFLDSKNVNKNKKTEKSRFGTQSNRSLLDIQQNQDQNGKRFSQSDSTHRMIDSQITQSRKKSKQIKKGQNLSKMKMNKNILKKIDQQIQKQNKKFTVTKTINKQLQQQYEKQRQQTRKRIRDEQARKHLQFLAQMKQKQHERQQSNMSQCEMKKNNLRAHYQRNKLFIKKMEMTLVNNQQLKGVIINYQDDLLTKKRKVRILKKLLDNSQHKQTQFYQDIKKYIDIFEKTCNMILGTDKKKFRKYTKRKINTQKYFDYDLPEQAYEEFNDDFNSIKQLLKIDHQLKFYLVKLVFLEQQDFESLQTHIKSYITHKVNHFHRHRNILLPQKSTGYLLDTQGNELTLVQTCLQQKFINYKELEQFNQHNQDNKQNERQFLFQQEILQQNLKRNFQLKMEKYNKLLKNKNFK